MNINLDKNFNPFHSGKEIAFETFIFSGGETHIKILSEIDQQEIVNISHRIQSFNDFGLLLMAIDAIKRLQVKTINLFIPYFPAARQDRVMTEGEALSVKVYADILNLQNLNSIHIYDAHSDVTPALLNNSNDINNFSFVKNIMKEMKKDCFLISPDGGALKKVYKLAEALQDFEVIECSKQRDVKTRKLSGFKVYAEDLKQRDCLIVDDICDGGRTFIGLAKKLKERNAGNIYLAVSHGIFSKGFEELNKSFTKIFTTNAFKDYTENEKMSVYSLKL